MKKIFIFVSILLFITILVFETLNAFNDGIVNLTRRRGNTEGCTCHGLSTSAQVHAFITGPSSVRAGDTAEYRLKITGGPLVRAGCDISAANGLVIVSALDTMLQRIQATVGVYELTHKWPKLTAADTVTFIYRYIAPNTPGTFDTLYANANSVNFDSLDTGDMWNYAADRIISITSSIDVRNISTNAADFRLMQNYPNPFNPATKIVFSIRESGNAKLSIFDLTGREVASPFNGYMRAGTYEYTFSGNGLAGGVYFYRLISGGFTETKKMILTK
ncbi:MAG: T9SS type A sorting domain-containing protein [Bacteroidetes bacterium]|nr:T9SS type A sorting domain-containing protein [Bacteroidota bacterium]